MAKDKSEHDHYYRSQERKKTQKEHVPTDEEPELPPPVAPVKGDEKVGRNAPCPCGSGKKYKQCCGRA